MVEYSQKLDISDPGPPSYIECSGVSDDFMVLEKPNYDELFKKLLDRLRGKWDRDASDIVEHYNDIEKSIVANMNGEIETIKNHYSQFLSENKNKLNIELRKYNSVKETQINEILSTKPSMGLNFLSTTERVTYVTSIINLIKTILFLI